MDKHIKIKAMTTIICLILSIFALYTFVFVAEVSKGWRMILVIISKKYPVNTFYSWEIGRAHV